MNVQVFKEPAATFVFTAIMTMVFLFIESRYTGEKKEYRDYTIYGIFVGMLSILMLYMFKMGPNSGNASNSVSKSFLLDRFPSNY
jgi:hypothetical membrane protein